MIVLDDRLNGGDGARRNHHQHRPVVGTGPMNVVAQRPTSAGLAHAQRLPLLLLQTAWAGKPPSKEPRCFHVTRYTLSWAPQTRDAVAEACRSSGVVYVRGDEAGDARIIHSIWNEICQATDVVVDITG